MKHREIQKTLAAIALFVVTLAVVLHFVVLGPRFKRNAGLRSGNAQQQKDLEKATGRKWELDPERLAGIRQQYEQYRGKYLDQFVAVLGRANKEFEPLIDPQQNGLKFQDWKVGVMLFDYQERFLKVKRDLESQQVFLNDEQLGLTEASAPPEGQEEYTYRLLARLHIVGEVAGLCRRNGLRLDAPREPPKSGAEPSRPKALIKSLPVRVYVTEANSEPFAEEYPVQLTVRGTLPDLCRFLESLTAGDRFLPLDRIAVSAAGVDNFLKSGYQSQAHEEIEATIVCSGFILLSDLEKLRAEKGPSSGGEQTWRPGA